MAKNTSPKTNAMRVLDQRKIIYQAVTYSPEIHSATEVAALLGVSPAQVYKTLVVLPESGQGRPLLVLVPGDKEVDLKVFGANSGEKKVRMATQREAENLTGLLVGGISALALLQKGFRVFIAEEALQLEQIYVSAGQRGINLQLARTDLIKITGATPVKVA
ncbi:MAG: aminoacyl-tRNA deacylase [Chloroflexota bacterium]|nr:aminoacyl-tRNA deacylase [Chloroflexota bacterium]